MTIEESIRSVRAGEPLTVVAPDIQAILFAAFAVTNPAALEDTIRAMSAVSFELMLAGFLAEPALAPLVEAEQRATELAGLQARRSVVVGQLADINFDLLLAMSATSRITLAQTRTHLAEEQAAIDRALVSYGV